MSEVLGSALIEIQPDFSRFEDELAKGLQAAAAKVQKNAQVNFQVNQKDISSASGTIDQLNTSINNLTKSIDRFTATQKNVNDGFRRNKKAAEEQATAQSKLLTVFQTVAPIISYAVLVRDLSSEFVGLAKAKTAVLDFFSKFSKETDPTKVSSFGKAIEIVSANFQRVPKEFTVTKQIFDANRALQTTITTTTKLDNGLKTVTETVSDAAGTLVKESIESTGAIKGGLGAIVDGTKKVKDSYSQSQKQAKDFADVGTKAANQVRTALQGKGGGPGTTSFAEFQSKEALPFFERISTFAKQAGQNIRFAFSSPKTVIADFKTSVTDVFSGFKDKALDATAGLRGFGGLINTLGNGFNAFKDKVSNLAATFTKFRESGGLLNFTLGAIGEKLLSLGPKALAGGATAGIALVTAGVGKAITSLASKASDLNESQNAIAVTLGNAAAPFKSMIGDVSKLGLTELQLNDALTPIVPLLKNAGLEGGALATKLNTLTRRAIDLGSIFNKQTSDVLPALGAALRGEVDPAERLGISFNAAAVDAKALELGFKKTNGQFAEADKQLARLELIFEKSNFAAGDYARTSNQLANATRNFHAVIADLGLEFSKAFLPASNKIIAAMNRLATEAAPKLKIIFAALVVPVDALGFAVAGLVNIIADIVEGFNNAGQVVKSFITGAIVPLAKSINDIAIQPIVSSISSLASVIGSFLSPLQAANIGIKSFGITVATAFAAFKISERVIPLTVSLLLRLSNVLIGLSTGAIGGAGVAIQQLGLKIAALAGPITVITTGIIFMISRINQLNSAAKQSAKSVEDGFDPNALDGFTDSIKAAQAEVDKTKKKLDSGLQINIGSFKIAPFKDVNKQIANATAATSELNRLTGQQAQKQDILKKVATQTGESITEVFARAKDAGIDFLNLPTGKAALTVKDLADSWFKVHNTVTLTSDKVTEALNGMNLGASAFTQKYGPDLGKVFEEVAKQANESFNSLNEVISSQQALKSAKQSEIDAGKQITETSKKINELQTEKLKLQNDTLRATNEEADAKDRIKDVEKQITDLAQERTNLNDEDAKRQRDFLPTLSDFEDRITLANIETTRAKKDALKAQQDLNDALNQGEKAQLNLAGLSLDEVRSRLASFRAATAAQRAVTKAADQTDIEALRDNVTEANIKVKESEENVNKLHQDRTDFIEENIKKQKEFNDKIASLADQEARLRRDRATAAADYQKLLNGEIGVKKDIKDLDTQLKDLNAQLTDLETRKKDAAQQTALAQLQSQLSVATQKGDLPAILSLTGQIAIQKANIAGSDRDTLNSIRDQINQINTLNASIKSLQNRNITFNINGVLTNIQGNLSSYSDLPSSLRKAAEALTAASAFSETAVRNIAEIAAKTGVARPSLFAEGGVLTQPTNLIAGEAGREVILPLTRPYRMAELMSRPDVLNPILSTLPKINLANTVGPGGLTAQPGITGLGNSNPRTHYTPSLSAKPTPTEQKLDRLIELLEVANSTDGGLNAPISITGVSDPDRAAKKAVREMENMLNRRRRGR